MKNNWGKTLPDEKSEGVSHFANGTVLNEKRLSNVFSTELEKILGSGDVTLVLSLN